MGTPTRNDQSDQSGCGCGSSSNESAATNPAKTSGTAPSTGGDRRTGPGTGNTRGNDLPSEAKTTRDTRTVEGGIDATPGRQAQGSEVTGSQGQNAPEVIDAD